MNRVQDLKNHIAAKYPKLSSKNFDIAKIGARIYIYLVDINGNFSGYWIKLPNRQDPNLYHLNERGLSEQIIP